MINAMWDEWTTGTSEDPDTECAGLLAGLLTVGNSEASADVLRPKHLRVARRILKLWRMTAWFSRWNIADTMTLPNVSIRLPIGFREELLDIARGLAVTVNRNRHTPSPVASAWLRGLWGSCGGLYLPKSGYYLVLRVREPIIADALHEMLVTVGALPWRERLHFGAREFTLRELESIVTFLCFGGYSGLSNAALALEDRAIVRSMRGQANRGRNCDGANINRTVRAAKEQVKLAQAIVNGGLLEKLPAATRELVELRLANPESSLAELGAKLSKPITKSSVKYKWERLKELIATDD